MSNTIKKIFKKWWNGLIYEPDDPRHLTGSEIKIAVVGGGTGLSTLLRGLKIYSHKITAVVAVTDDGASSGRLRKEYDILPPGDIRQCISALSLDEALIADLMEFRFDKGNNSLSGHALGNVWITALTKYFGSFEKAIEATMEIFQTAGKVVPATLDNIELCAEYDDGSVCKGESSLGISEKKIKKVFLNRRNVRVYKNASSALREADLIIIGPGSLYTSVIPNLLISGIRKAISNNKKAVKVYVVNCSTEKGETENYSVEDHINSLLDHSNKNIIDFCLVNSVILKKSKQHAKLGEINNITTDKDKIMGVRIVKEDVVNEKKPLYHDSDKLAKKIIMLYNKYKK